MMRGVAVALLLLFWTAPAFSQAGPHANVEVTDSDNGGGHALNSGEIPPGEAVGEAETGGDFCAGATGVGGYACRAGAFFFGSVERTVVTFMALLALSTLLLWFNTRKAVTAAQDRGRAYPRGRARLCVRRAD